MSTPQIWAWLRGNGHDLAGLTGQDQAALKAIDQTWALYARTDTSGRPMVLDAVGSLARCVQPKFRHLGRELVARNMDWSDRDRLWSMVTSKQLSLLDGGLR